jgi:hypothetical protein
MKIISWSKLLSIDHYDETLLPASSSRDVVHLGPEKDLLMTFQYMLIDNFRGLVVTLSGCE